MSLFLEKKLSLITSRNCFPTDSFHQSHSKQLVTSPFSNREKSTDSRRWVVVLATFFLEKIEKHHWLYIRFRGASRCDCCSSCWWTNQGVDFSPFWSQGWHTHKSIRENAKKWNQIPPLIFLNMDNCRAEGSRKTRVTNKRRSWNNNWNRWARRVQRAFTATTNNDDKKNNKGWRFRS